MAPTEQPPYLVSRPAIEWQAERPFESRHGDWYASREPVAEKQLNRYYELVRTPVAAGEPVPEEPCTIPAGIAIPPKRNVFTDSSIEVMVPDRSSVYGFVASWGLVGVLIYFFFAVTR